MNAVVRGGWVGLKRHPECRFSARYSKLMEMPREPQDKVLLRENQAGDC